MNKPVTKFYIFAGVFGLLMAFAGLHMDNWRFWLLLLWAIIGCSWVAGDKKNDHPNP